jgi:hypothetical protein
MNWPIAAVVGLTDCAITFFNWQQLDSWLMGRKLHAVLWDMALTIAIGVNVMGFVTAGWPMLGASVVGSALGTYFSFKWRLW